MYVVATAREHCDNLARRGEHRGRNERTTSSIQ
jgi:hypothetical protein